MLNVECSESQRKTNEILKYEITLGPRGTHGGDDKMDGRWMEHGTFGNMFRMTSRLSRRNVLISEEASRSTPAEGGRAPHYCVIRTLLHTSYYYTTREISSKNIAFWSANIQRYYTALLNVVERSVHLHWPSRLLVVNYFSIMTNAYNGVKERSFVSLRK